MRRLYSLLLVVMALMMPKGARTALSINSTFTVDGITYTVTNNSPNEVAVGGIKRGNNYYAVDINTAQTLTSVIIPAQVTEPSEGVVYSVTSFRSGAFSMCSNLTEIHTKLSVLRRNKAGGGSSVFHNNTYENATLYVPAGSMTFYTIGDNYPWHNFKNVVPEGENLDNSLAAGESFIVDGISYQVIYPFEVMVGSKRPNAITAIDAETKGEIEIPAVVKDPNGNQYTVSAIGDDAFRKCSKLTSVALPKTLISIGLFAFSGCSGLSCFTIPENVINIESGILSYCSGLTSINVEEGNGWYSSPDNCNAIIYSSAGNINKLISGCKNTKVPENLRYFDQWAFAGITGLTSFTFPDGPESVSFNMFTDCI